MGMFWQIGNCGGSHPYGKVDQYWNNNMANTVDTLAVHYNEYRWPPLSNLLPTDFYAPGGVGTHPQTGTSCPGYTNYSAKRPTHGDAVGSFEGNTHFLKFMRVTGEIVLADPQNSSGATAGVDYRYKLGLNQVNLFHQITRTNVSGDPTVTKADYGATCWLRIVFVQQFKQHKGEPDLQPSDVFKHPFHTSVDVGGDSGREPIDWLNVEFNSQFNTRMALDYDVNRQDDLSVGGAPAQPSSASGVGVVPHRTRKFKVINFQQIRFSAQPLDTRQLRSIKIDKRFYPVKRRMDVVQSKNVEFTYHWDMNPCFLWFIPSRDGATTAGTATPHLFERCDIGAVWHDDN
jgi:hypothetical protein